MRGMLTESPVRPLPASVVSVRVSPCERLKLHRHRADPFSFLCPLIRQVSPGSSSEGGRRNF